MFPEHIETESLELRQLSEASVDVFELYELFSDSRGDVTEVFEHVPQEPYATVNETRERLQKAQSAWDDGDAAQHAIVTADEELAGFTGLFLE